MGPSRRPLRLPVACLHAWFAGAVLASPVAQALTLGGDVALTSDYIYRGISESDGQPAAQLDLHGSAAGTFAGVFTSTLRKVGERGPDFELDEYLGHRFDLSPSWGTTVTAVNYSYHGGNLLFSDDYQELGATLSYLDRWSLSVAAAPNIVRYAREYRLGRYPAYVADTSVQLPIVGRLFATAAIGYYSLTGPHGSGYSYGNAGVGYERGAWRFEAGYFVTRARAQYMFPYGRVRDELAATLSWQF